MKNTGFRRMGKARFVLIPIMALAFLAFVSYVVMQLWNVILPEVIHVEPISFWQAAGIFILCKLLFGFGPMGKPGFGKHKMMKQEMMKHRLAERLKNMSPEERSKFKERFGRHRFGGFDKWCGEDFSAAYSEDSTGSGGEAGKQ